MNKIQMFKQVEEFRNNHESAVRAYGVMSEQSEREYFCYMAAKEVLKAGGLFNDYFEWRMKNTK